MTISIIVAVASNGIIGKNGQIPWRISADLKRFKALTMGHPIVMGRKTHESIGKVLPGRLNIILSRSGKAAEGCVTARSLAAALTIAAGSGASQVFITGGAAVYAETLPTADRLYLTRIEQAFEGDTFFPEVNWDNWQLQSEERLEPSEQAPYTVSFQVYERRK